MKTVRLVALLAVLPAGLAAQRDSTARLTGNVISARSGAPLTGVMIALPQAKTFAVSDSTGAFALAGIPAGTQPLRILYREQVFYDQPITLKAGKTRTLNVLLDVEAVELEPVVVEAQSMRAAHSLAGFYDRRRFGFGRFYSFDDLARRGGVSLRTLLIENGVQVRCWNLSCVALGSSVARPCVMPVYRDNMPFPIDDLDLVRLDELAAVEVYKHGLEVPPEFWRGSDGGCGAIIIWSRY